MMKFGCLLAQLDGLNPMNPGQPVGRSTGLVLLNLMVILATGLAVGLVLFLCARYFMGKKRHRHHHHHHHESRAESTPAVPVNGDQQNEAGGPDGHRHRRRRRRRDHRPRNPTLGETGGLPPSKTEPSPNSPL